MSSNIINTNAKNFDKDVLQNSLPVIVYFYSEDCPPCIALTPIFDRMSEMYSGHMKFVKLFRQQNRELAEKLGVKSSPTLLFFKNANEVCSRLNGYISKAELKKAIDNVTQGACTKKEREKLHCDVLILGAGPAGLSAAIYAARAKLYAVVIDEAMPGGQVTTTFHIANYPGTNGVIRGIDLVENMKRQALDFGTQLDDMKEVSNIDFSGDEKHVETEDVDYFAKCIIIATGAEARKLPAEGEREFRGRGVHYCATCDGAMYQDADILVIGGGNSAVEEAIYLTRYAKHVTIVHQLDHFQASKISQEEVFKNPAIDVIWNSEIRQIKGDKFVESVIIENLKTKDLTEKKTDGLFVFIGMQPRTEIFKGKINLNEGGCIITDNDMRTNVAGVFAAGDVREKSVRQIATAAADGVISGIMAERYVNGK